MVTKSTCAKMWKAFKIYHFFPARIRPRAQHTHTALPDPKDPWCAVCDMLLTWAIEQEEKEMNHATT